MAGFPRFDDDWPMANFPRFDDDWPVSMAGFPRFDDDWPAQMITVLRWIGLLRMQVAISMKDEQLNKLERVLSI